LGYAFASKTALMQELNYMQTFPFWAGKEFVEISYDELQEKSIMLDKEKQIQEEKSDVYIKPSEVAKSVNSAEIKQVDMVGRGVESLTRMSDRDVVERASKTQNGAKFNQLWKPNKFYRKRQAKRIVQKPTEKQCTRYLIVCKRKTNHCLT